MDLYSSFAGFIEVITSLGEIVVDDNLFGEHPWLKLIIKPVFSYGSLPRPPDLHSTVVSHMRIMAQSSPLVDVMEMDYVFAGQGLCLPQELFGWLKNSTLVVIGSSRIEIHSDVVFALCATLELLLTQNLLQPHTMPHPLLYGLDCHGLVVQQSCSTHKPLLTQQWWLHYLCIGTQSMEQLRYGLKQSLPQAHLQGQSHDIGTIEHLFLDLPDRFGTSIEILFGSLVIQKKQIPVNESTSQKLSLVCNLLLLLFPAQALHLVGYCSVVARRCVHPLNPVLLLVVDGTNITLFFLLPCYILLFVNLLNFEEMTSRCVPRQGIVFVSSLFLTSSDSA